MKQTDKFLAAIVLGILVLIVAAVIMVVRQPAPSYKEETSAENVAHNYLLAIQQEDYARAYGYLSPSLKGYPASLIEFTDNIRRYSYRFARPSDSISIEIGSSRELASTTGVVEVEARRTFFFRAGLFGSNQYSLSFTIELQRENGPWKVRGGDFYFLTCWTESKGCD